MRLWFSTRVTTLRKAMPGQPFLLRKLEVLVASLAISMLPARTSGSPTAGICTGLFARREKIAVTRSGSPFEHSPVPMGRAHRPTRAQFAHFPGECLKPKTRWRSGEDSNSRFRCPTWGKLYRNGHFGTHFGPKNLRVSGFSRGFKPLSLDNLSISARDHTGL